MAEVRHPEDPARDVGDPARDVGDPARDVGDPAHDVLAAEEFAMPGPDPALHRPQVTVPEDPSGIAAPHDVLAAEEFAMPAAVEEVRRSVANAPGWAKLGAAAAGLLAVLRLRRRR